MAQQRYSRGFATAPPPVIPTTKESSILMNMLPSLVQSRMPRLPSIRRSVSIVGLRARRGIRSRQAAPPDDSKALVLSGKCVEDCTTDSVDDSSSEECEAAGLR